MGDDGPVRRPLSILGLVAILGVAPTVHADPGGADPNLDASFLDALARAGITVISPSGALKDAKSACGMMAKGQPELDVIKHVTGQNPGLGPTRAAQFTAIAASAYCPQFLQRATDTGGPGPAQSAHPGT
ncbi:MAG: DUF732 domain-containing protein [Mycobacterium sp.]|nr:DUF732 domain-containing protein [Mycobacterium sp.]